MENERLVAFVVVASFGVLLYTYAGYPALLWLLGRILPPRATEPDEPGRWPNVSIILSAYNEEAVIEARIRNLLQQDYPGQQLEILIGSDGSSDRTCQIVERWRSERVRLVAFTERRGKASVINDLIAMARGEVIVLTDANTVFRSQAVRELVRGLSRHPSACAVVGRLEIHSPAATGNLDGAYWRYETWIEMLESRFGWILNHNGAIYAFRRERYQPIPEGTIVDDLMIPMMMRLHRGGRVFMAPTAQAWERASAGIGNEFHRRVRIGAGNLHALLWTWPLLLPWNGTGPAYFSHKFLRWCAPVLLLVGFGANLALLGVPFFRLLFFGQLACYGLALLAPLLRRVSMVGLVAAALRFFFVMNAALLLGFIQFALGAARPFWTATSRPVLPEGLSAAPGGAGAFGPGLATGELELDRRGVFAATGGGGGGED